MVAKLFVCVCEYVFVCVCTLKRLCWVEDAQCAPFVQLRPSKTFFNESSCVSRSSLEWLLFSTTSFEKCPKELSPHRHLRAKLTLKIYVCCYYFLLNVLHNMIQSG